MNKVYRCFAEKREGFDVEARGLCAAAMRGCKHTNGPCLTHNRVLPSSRMPTAYRRVTIRGSGRSPQTP